MLFFLTAPNVHQFLFRSSSSKSHVKHLHRCPLIIHRGAQACFQSSFPLMFMFVDSIPKAHRRSVISTHKCLIRSERRGKRDCALLNQTRQSQISKHSSNRILHKSHYLPRSDQLCLLFLFGACSGSSVSTLSCSFMVELFFSLRFINTWRKMLTLLPLLFHL